MWAINTEVSQLNTIKLDNQISLPYNDSFIFYMIFGYFNTSHTEAAYTILKCFTF